MPPVVVEVESATIAEVPVSLDGPTESFDDRNRTVMISPAEIRVFGTSATSLALEPASQASRVPIRQEVEQVEPTDPYFEVSYEDYAAERTVQTPRLHQRLGRIARAGMSVLTGHITEQIDIRKPEATTRNHSHQNIRAIERQIRTMRKGLAETQTEDHAEYYIHAIDNLTTQADILKAERRSRNDR